MLGSDRIMNLYDVDKNDTGMMNSGRDPSMNRSNTKPGCRSGLWNWEKRLLGCCFPPYLCRKWSQRCNHPTAMCTSLDWIRVWCLRVRSVSFAMIPFTTWWYEHVICWPITCNQLDIAWYCRCHALHLWHIYGLSHMIFIYFQHLAFVRGWCW